MEENIPPAPEDTTENGEKEKVAAPDAQEIVKEAEKPRSRISTKLILRIILVLVIILVPLIIYFVKDFEISRLNRINQAEKDSLELKYSAMVDASNERQLREIALVFSWTARAEVLLGDTANLNRIMIGFVKGDTYKKVFFVDEMGRIILSTDKKMEGFKATKFYTQHLTDSKEIQIFKKGDGDLLVSAPVMDGDRRVGTLGMEAAPPRYLPKVSDTTNQY